nr:unnamed protein product [Callosobruchus analis]
MDYTDFLDFKKFSKSTVINKKECADGGILNWQKVKWIQCRKGQPNKIFFEERMTDPEFRSIIVQKVSKK